MSKRDPYAFIQIGRYYLLLDSIVSWEQGPNKDGSDGQFLYVTMSNGFLHSFADPEGEHLARLVDEFTMDPPETGFVDQADIRVQFEEAAKREPMPKDTVRCECEVCVEERGREALSRELGALAKRDTEAIRTLKGGPLDESDVQWWLGLGATVRAETRPTLLKMAETSDPRVRGELLGELIGKTMSRRSKGLQDLLDTLFGSPASKAR